jgi:alkanesulfonate monooxygenase SsuD/methylene tetrahydromethanopterin reductase-like flavin-dependent oxidoreductase (luciferase family)
MGGWADGLITIGQRTEAMRRVIDAFREGGGEGKPLFLQAQLSYAPSREEALQAARREWGTNIFESRVLSDLRMPADFESLARYVHDAELTEAIRVSPDAGQHAEWIRQDFELGFDRVLLHCVHRDQGRFIEDFGERVLPAVL